MTHASDLLRAYGPGTVLEILTRAGIVTDGMGRDARREVLLDHLRAFSAMQARGQARGTAKDGRLIWEAV